MALENLKFAFPVINKPSTSIIGGRHDGEPGLNLHPADHSFLDIDEIIPFTPAAIEDLLASSNLTPDSDDLRFSAGFGWTSPAAKIQVSTEGGQASLNFINTATGLAISANGAINKWGTLSEKLAKAGIDTPNIPFDTDILTPPPFLKYQDTVLELAGDTELGIPGGFTYTPTDADAQLELAPRYRGNVFQVLGNNSYLTPTRYGEYINPEIIPFKIAKSGNIVSVDANKKSRSEPPHNWPVPWGVGSQEFVDMQSIKFGVNENYPYYGFLDSVQNFMHMGMQNPLTSWIPGGIDNLKNLDLKITFKKSQLRKDVDRFVDENIKTSNLYKGLKETSQGIIDSISENDLIHDIGDAIGGTFKALGGWGKSLNFPNINLPNISFPGLGGISAALGDVLGGVGGALNGMGGLVGDVASYVLPTIGIEHNMSGGGIGGSLGEGGLQSPYDVQKSNYGGQAIFKNPAGTRTASTLRKPNAPNEPERSINKRYSDARVQPMTDRTIDKPTVNTPYAALGKTKYAYSKYNGFYPDQMAVGRGDGKGGDPMTIAPMLKGATLADAGYMHSIEGPDNGYPVYFKDLRDNTYIIFRGYVEAMTENVSPTWGSTNYIGRSEPTYIYERAERDFSFTLKLFAQTPHELDSIYGKMRRLTSLAYPEYQYDTRFTTSDSNGNIVPSESKRRMKPPLLKFRLAELYGNNSRLQLAFMKSLNYSWPDNSPWEFREGQRVPKHIMANIGLQILHEKVPNKNTLFYGYDASSIV